MYILTVLFLLISVATLANNETHSGHKAHVHGAATLSIAFDHLQGKIEFNGAAASLIGFEHEAKSEKEKQKLNEVILIFESNIGKMINIDSSLGCSFKKEKIAILSDFKSKEGDTRQAVHSDLSAVFNVICQKSILTNKLLFDFTIFPQLKDIDVTLLIGDLQKSIEIKGKPVSIELKP
jgi:hypothetical protein